MNTNNPEIKVNYQMNYPAGAAILQEGATGDCAYIIEKGLVEISVLREDEKIVLAVLSEGDIFGEMALVSGDVRSASAHALTPTSLSVICRPYFQEKLAQTDPIIAMLMKLLLERFHEARSKLLSMSKVCLLDLKPKKRDSDLTAVNTSQRETLERFKFINELQSALDRQELVLHYQPIYLLATGILVGFEALIRWNHPLKGNIPPSQFIDIAEDTKDIIPIGYWIFETACNDLKKMHNSLDGQTNPTLPWMSINISPVQIKDANLVGRFAEILSRCGVKPSAIKLELTEHVLVEDPKQALLFIHNVKQLGMKVAIDDFGTGYSSLSYLHMFPFDILKIDNTFVANIISDGRSQGIVNAIVALSKNLNIDIVAEGIENEALAAVLLDLGCRYGQGYAYSRPLPVEEATQFLQSHAG